MDFIEFFLMRGAEPGREPIVGVIGNPPYNCHESPYIRSNKDKLKAAFGRIGVLNTYALFLYAGLQLLQEGGVLCMVTMDSFLTNRGHRPLREEILRQSEIIEVLLAPRRLFHRQRADVRTAIVTLRKTGQPDPRHVMRLVDRLADEREYAAPRSVQRLPQEEFQSLCAARFVVGVPESVRRLFSGTPLTLGDAVPGGAGISTGNDRAYLRRGTAPPGWIPFVKNPAGSRFHYETDTFLTPEWETLAATKSNFIVRNRPLLLKEGVACSSMGVPFSAVRLPKGSLFGVNAGLFPRSQAERFFLLGLLNSALGVYMIRAVLNRTNMVTPGYVKSVPYRYGPDARACRDIAKLAGHACEAAEAGDHASLGELMERMDPLVFDLYEIPRGDRLRVSEFVQRIHEAL